MKSEYGKFGGAETVKLINSAGMSITLCALGAGIMSITVLDRDGVAREMTRLDDGGYANAYHGLTIGRTSGRIANAEFTLDGNTATLEKNNYGTDNLHGGKDGLHGKIFSMRLENNDKFTDVVFGYNSPDGEGGYFGNVKFEITYRVYDSENKFAIHYYAAPDRKTLVNLTNHAYFDVSGDRRELVSEQYMYLNASRYGELNERLIVQKISAVPPQFDFRTPRKIGEYLNDENVQRYTLGYDHPFFLDGRGTDKLACSLFSELSGILLEVRTTYPCVVIYGDNYGGYKSVCFECQYHPDGMHQAADDCGVCSPDKPYSETTEFSFSVK